MVIGMASRGVGAGWASARAESRGRRAARAARPAAESVVGSTADELPRSIRRAAGLEGFDGEAIDLPSPARATAAARAFATGNGYLTGLIVDRLA
jgi:hypothetical protein